MPTPSALMTTIRTQLAETATGFYTDDEIYAFMSTGEDHIARYTEATESYQTGSTAPNVRNYQLPTYPYTAVSHKYTVDLRVNKVKMQKVTMNDLDVIEGNQESTGTPQYYYEWGNNFFLVPTPVAVLDWAMYFISNPVDITAASTAFSVPEQFTDHIGDYCLWRLLSQDEKLERAAFHKNEWESALMEMQSTWAKRKRLDKDAFVKDTDLYRGNSAGVLRYLF